MTIGSPFNEYKIFDDHAVFYIINKKNETYKVKIDIDHIERLTEFNNKWYAKWAGWAYYVCHSEYLGFFNGRSTYKIHYLHRWLTSAKKKEYVDHINFDTLDNRSINLRLSSNSDNSKNRNGANSNNKSGYRNVCWDKWKCQWKMQLQINGKNTILGYFDDVHEAGKFAEEMREKHYKEFKGVQNKI